MLRRKVTGSASFVCLRCRLQLAGNGAAGAGTVAQRPPFSSSTSLVSALATLTVLPLARPWPQYYSTSSTEARTEGPNEIETKASTTDPSASPTALDEFSKVEHGAKEEEAIDNKAFDWDVWEQKYSSRASTTEDDFLKVFEANKVTEKSTRLNSFDFDWGNPTESAKSKALDIEEGTEEADGGEFDKADDTSLDKKWSLRRVEAKQPKKPCTGIITYTSLSSDPKIWSTRSGLVTAQTEGIEMGFMGSPASAIVLREKSRKELAPVRPLILREMDAEDMTKGEIDEAELLANHGIKRAASDEETLLHIHELQPAKRVLPNTDFVALKRTLMEGFTKPQLELYIEHWKLASSLRTETADEKDVSQPQWVLEYRPWVPAVKDAVEDVEAKLYGYITRSMTPKEKLATRLMRLCWGLSSRELYDKPGYLDVKLRDVEFKLLALGGKLWMNRISKRLLGEGMQIEMFSQSNWISIRAPKHSAHWILDNINQVLEHTVSAQFSKDFICPGPLAIDPSTWDLLSKMTNSVPRLDPTGTRVLVTWVQINEPDVSVEDPGEHVLRLLSYAYRPEPQASSSLLISPPSLSEGGRYLPEINCQKKLPWQYRNKNWTRWTSAASTMRNISGLPKTSHIPFDFLPFPIEGTRARGEYVAGQRLRGWSTEPRTDTSATFGHVLFQQKQGERSLAPAEPPNPSMPRTFVAHLPCIRNLDLKSNLKETGLWHTVTVMRFVPAPDLPPELVAHAPPLELRMDATHREIKRINDLRAIVHNFTGDVSFPNSLLDVRLHQNRYFIMDGADVEATASAILEFLEESQIEPWQGRFATPPSLNGMRLPRRVFTGKIATEGGPNDMLEIDYMYAGVELQRHVTAEYQGLKLHYTNIAGGWRRGQRSELSLDAQLVSDLQASNEAFFSLADEHGADGLDKKGTGLNMDMSSVLDVAETIKLLMDSDANKRAEEERKSGAELTAGKKVLDEAHFFKAVESLVTGNGEIEWLGVDRKAEETKRK